MDFRPTRDTFASAHKMEDPFGADPLCQLNLKETSDFVKAFPAAPRCSLESRSSIDGAAPARRGRGRVPEVPTTPGRPLLGFYGGNLARKSVPSKWEDAEKWLISSTSCRESPAHIDRNHKSDAFCQKGDAFVEKRVRAGEGRMHCAAIHRLSLDVPLKDKFTDVELVFPSFQSPEPAREGFLFKSSSPPCGAMKDASTEVVVDDARQKDVWTETTPLGSSAVSRSNTPVNDSSPARHNTPADRSGLLVPPTKSGIDVLELTDCHLAKLELGAQFDSVVSNWSSREEEEEDISKSLRHFEMDVAKKSMAESRASVWEDEARMKSCARYQREEAKIQAWVNLQSAKAEAQSRKLEVKIQKMRANLEEKLMKRMANVHKKAEEWRSSAQFLHSQEVQRASEQAQKMKNQHGIQLGSHTRCGCFPRSNHI